MKNLISVRSIVENTVSNENGYSLYLLLDKEIQKTGRAEISFEDISMVSSSFLNSSIGEIFDKYGFEASKSMIKYHQVEKSVAEIIRKYYQDYPFLIKQ